VRSSPYNTFTIICYDISVFLTSILCDEVDDMLLTSSLQGCQKLDALLFWCQQVEQRVVSSEDRSLTANVLHLSSGQNVTALKFIEQPKVWLNVVRKWRLQCRDGRQNTGLVNCMCHNILATIYGKIFDTYNNNLTQLKSLWLIKFYIEM